MRTNTAEIGSRTFHMTYYYYKIKLYGNTYFSFPVTVCGLLCDFFLFCMIQEKIDYFVDRGRA